MKQTLSLLAFVFCFVAAQPSFAGKSMIETSSADEQVDGLEFEFELHGAYIGAGDVKRRDKFTGREFSVEDFHEVNALARLLILPRTPIGILRLGAEYEIFDFGGGSQIFSSGAPPNVTPLPLFIPSGPWIPDRLQSIAGIIGLDTKLSDSLLIRFEAKPGVYYTDHIDGRDFNVPFVLGGTYLYSSDLQFVFGIGVDLEREYPVLPGGGIRWRFAPQWVLNATLPAPRLEYELSRNFMIYAGGDLRSKTVRIDQGFVGDLGNVDALDNGVLSYTEIRTGVGVMWKIGETSKLSVEGGYVPYREFDYHRADVRYKSDGGAPYGAITFSAKF
jgi:hypothetical protein